MPFWTFTAGNIITIVLVVIWVSLAWTNVLKKMSTIETRFNELVTASEVVPKALLLERLELLRGELRKHLMDDAQIQSTIARDLVVHRDEQRIVLDRLENMLIDLVRRFIVGKE